MISVTAQSAALVQRLRARAARLAAAYAARGPRRTRRSRVDWHSATDLWPEFTGVSSDGK
jgi:hypothetical protein